MTSRLDQDDTLEADRASSTDESRRSFLTAGLSGAILAGFATRLEARASAPPPTIPPTQPHTSNADLAFLIDRVTNGYTLEEWTRAKTLGYQGYLEEQLAYSAINDAAMDATLLGYPTLSMTSKQIYDTYIVPNQNSVPVTELKTATILRAAYSKRQLYERMVEFWSDHFSVDHGDGQIQWLKTAEDRDVIRAHALGNFHDLLLADAKSAAMSYSLDNYRNFASAPNENYGREVMELHSLGVGHFAEADVPEAARCLTGWQYYSQNQPNHGAFFFNAGQHDNGSKTVLGHTIQLGGVADGEQLILILATHPSTATFIARKMCRWLLAYEPPQGVVDSVARVFVTTRGDIKSMVRKILSRDTVSQIAPTALPKIKRPFHLVCSFLRTCNPTMTQPSRLATELKTMGHWPFAWPAPNGYPDIPTFWGSTLLPRWNFLIRFINGNIAGATVNVGTLFAGATKSELTSRANSILTGGRMTPEDVAAVQSYANAAPTLNDTLRRDVLALAASTPSFQLY